MTSNKTWVQDPSGLWHVAVTTYPGSADTKCGFHVRIQLFEWDKKPSGHRPDICKDCVKL